MRYTASYKHTTNRPECKTHKRPKCLRISDNIKIIKHTATSINSKCSRTNATKRICAKIIITQHTRTPQGAKIIQTFKCSCTHPNAHPANMMSQQYKTNAYIKDLTSLRPYIAKLTNHRHNCSPVICANTQESPWPSPYDHHATNHAALSFCELSYWRTLPTSAKNSAKPNIPTIKTSDKNPTIDTKHAT